MIETGSLTKRYGCRALDGLSSTVQPGAVTGLVGLGFGAVISSAAVTILTREAASSARLPSSLRWLSRRLRNINSVSSASASRRPISWNSRSSCGVQTRGCEH